MSFLSRTASYYARQAGSDLSGYVFVFSNRRAGLFFRKSLAEELNSPVFAPRMITINECFSAFSSLRSADQLTLLFTLYEEYCKLLHLPNKDNQPESFDDFLYKGRTILSDFSEVDNHLVSNVESLFQTISDIKEIDAGFTFLSDEQRRWLKRFWGDYLLSAERHKDDERHDFHTPFAKTWALLSPLYTAFKERLKSEGTGYEGMIHRDAIERLSSGETGTDDITKYVFVGFNALSASERRLMQLLKKAGKAEFFFDYESPFLSDPACRASLFMQQNIADFGRPPFDNDEEQQHQLPQVRWIKVPSDVAETFEVNRILEEKLTVASDTDWTRTAIVMPDERLLLPLLRSIPKDIDVVNVSMGYPLASTSLWALLEGLIRLQTTYRNGAFYYRDILTVLRHPLLAGLFETEGAKELHDLIVRGRWLFVAASTIRKIQDKHTNTRQLLTQVFRPAETAEELIDYLISILALLSDEAMNGDEALYIMQSTLNRLHNVLSTRQHISRDMQVETLFGLMKMLLSDATIPFVGEPLQGLQVLGVLETRALAFDDVIITGFNDDLYPGHSSADSFIPYSIRRAFGLPVQERQDAIFAYNFYHLFSSARRVWFVTNSLSDDRRSGEPSRFLNQLRYQYNVPIEEEHVLFLPHADHQSDGDISKTAERMHKLEKKVFEDGLSPSAINTYFRCQKLFYYQAVCGLREPDELDNDVAANDFGTWFHGVMEDLYRPYLNKQLTASDIDDIAAHLPTLLADMPILEAVKNDRLLMNVLEQYATSMLLFDRDNTPFTIIGLEKEHATTLPLNNGREARLKGTIDRIDMMPDGTIRVIDYKTGKSPNTYNDMDELFDTESNKHNSYALQTLLYCYFYEQEHNETRIEPHLYNIRKVSAEKKDLDTLVHRKGEEIFVWQDAKKEYISRLATLIEDELLQKDKPFKRVDKKKTEQICVSCPMRSLCELPQQD